jgi:co-chaperonin GroES (HSP10)
MKKEREIILVGDRVLIDPEPSQSKTPAGLYLPPGVKEKEKVQGGYVIKAGPGYPVPDIDDVEDEPWLQEERNEPKYIPLQAEEGDYAIFMRKAAVEIEIDEKKYLIVPHSAILVLIRDNLLDE